MAYNDKKNKDMKDEKEQLIEKPGHWGDKEHWEATYVKMTTDDAGDVNRNKTGIRVSYYLKWER
jgi:hypothetical protein